jgi:hypothetical protein
MPVSGWMRETEREDRNAITPVGLVPCCQRRANAANYEAATEGAHEWIEMNQSLPAVSIVAGDSAE